MTDAMEAAQAELRRVFTPAQLAELIGTLQFALVLGDSGITGKVGDIHLNDEQSQAIKQFVDAMRD